jgi:hypothetical protein
MEYQGKKMPLNKILSKRKKKPHQNPIKLCCYRISREKENTLKKNSLKKAKCTKR